MEEQEIEPDDDFEESADPQVTAEIIKGLTQVELTETIRTSSETYNLAQDMEESALRELGQEVYDGFKEDDESRSSWLEQHAFWLSLYMQNDYAESASTERSWGATESLPILTEACDQFQSRTYKIFFPNDTFVSAVPMRRSTKNRKELEDRANRIGRHMSYQLGFLDRSYKQDKDALFLGVALHGSFFTKTYFSEQHRRFKVDNVRPTDLVINYNVGGKRLDEIRRKSHIIYTTVGETEELKNKGYFIDSAKEADGTIASNVYNQKVDEVTGVLPPNNYDSQNKQAILIEQHTFLDPDDTGFYRPYIVTICACSRKVLRVTIGYEADEMGNPLDNYKQVQYFTHYKYKENPDGFYGLGLGHSIGDLNSAVNIMLRQSIDAATLANDGNMSGFISERLGIEGDEVRMSIGKFRKIPDTVGDIQNSMWTGQFPGPNGALMTLMEALDQRAQRLGSVTEATTGASDKVLQPTTLINQIEQSLEQFSSVQTRLANSLSEELQKIYKINQKYLPFIEYFVVNNEQEVVTRADYAEDMLIQPIFDPKFSTYSQKVARAQAELEATLNNPVNQTRPQVMDAAFRRYLEALDVENIEELIPPQPEVENFDDQYVENMFFLQPKESRPLFDVFPDQDHAVHLQKIQEFLAEIPMLGVQLQPDQMEDILKHKQKHEGYLYGQLKGIIPPPPPNQVPTPPLEARQNNDMGDGAITETVPADAAVPEMQILG